LKDTHKMAVSLGSGGYRCTLQINTKKVSTKIKFFHSFR